MLSPLPTPRKSTFWRKNWNNCVHLWFSNFLLMKRSAVPWRQYQKSSYFICGSPRYTFSYEKEGCPLATIKDDIFFFYELRVKGAWNYVYLVHQIQNFLRQGLKIIVHLWSLKYTYSLYEEEGCPLNYDHQECYIQFRLKGAWNYEYLAHQIQHFLWHGCAAPRPLATIEYVHIHIDQKKGNEVMYLKFPNTLLFFLEKGGLPPCNHQKLYTLL